MKNKNTLYHFILDKSASMSDVREETVVMFNKQVDLMKELSKTYTDQNFYAGMTMFNDTVEHVYSFAPSEEIGLLRYERYLPSGMTALYDAIGESVSRIKERYSEDLTHDKMSVVVVVLTDGHENASREYRMDEIARLIKELEFTEKWSFSILGADFDITSVSEQLNFQASDSRQYSKKSYFMIEDDIEESIRSYADKKSKGIIDKDFLKEKKRTR